MTAIVDIWNMALSHVGHSTPVSDPNTETTTAANLCRTFYANCRDTTLREVKPGFARCRIAMALITSTATNWKYAYAYPADCLSAIGIVQPGQRELNPDDQVPYEVGFLSGQKVIFTDQAGAELVYTARVENLNLWDPTSALALSYLLASNIGVPLSGKADLAANARQAYFAFVSAAGAQGLNEGKQGPTPECEFNSVRNI